MSDSVSSAINANEAYCQAVEAMHRIPSKDGVDPETKLEIDDLLIMKHQAIIAALDAYNDLGNWEHDDVPRVHLPRHIAFEIGQLVGDVLRGHLPESVDTLYFGRGRPGQKAVQKRSVEWAVRYLALCRQGWLNDQAPLSTVAERFGVDKRTVQRWQANGTSNAEYIIAALDNPDKSDDWKRKLVEYIDHICLQNGIIYRESRHKKSLR